MPTLAVESGRVARRLGVGAEFTQAASRSNTPRFGVGFPTAAGVGFPTVARQTSASIFCHTNSKTPCLIFATADPNFDL
jgi:hypothetical protein